MRELSLNILDIAQNSISAGASLIEIELVEDRTAGDLLIGIYDNGKGMSEEQTASITDPFFTTRTTRKVGMGIPLFKMAAEQTGGSFEIYSKLGEGTRVTTHFNTGSIDFTPLGDIRSTVITLITMNTDRDFRFTYRIDGKEFALDTRELKEILGDVPLDTPDVVEWMNEYFKEQTELLLQ
ncbi:MAG: ATP-binding protein [Clostridiales bacterium]|nr:ATP-binding protein [Clostridiales bacterium]